MMQAAKHAMCSPRLIIKESGRGSRIRTRGLRIWNPLLYQLSYTPKAVYADSEAWPPMQEEGCADFHGLSPA